MAWRKPNTCAHNKVDYLSTFINLCIDWHPQVVSTAPY